MKPPRSTASPARSAVAAGALLLLLFAPAPLRVQAQFSPTPEPGPIPQAPPPAPPIETRAPAFVPQGSPPGPSGPATLYSVGQPTDEEQLYLEYINRSRANPASEGARLANATDPNVLSAYAFFGVDLSLMQSEFATNPPVPPLAMNAQLLAAARWHSGDMFTNQFQNHNGSDGLTVAQRITDRGYNWYCYGENIYSYAYSVFHGHAGFNVDWGTNPPSLGGMQNPPGHRNNIHSAAYREVGVGVVDGVNGTVGPQLVTQDFGTRLSATPLLCGVVYYDFNGNGFYDVGEGIGGVTVAVSGSSYYAVTADSGGYTVPVTTNGNYTLTFSGPGLASVQRTVTVSGLANAKVDWVPAYTPPVVSGPNPAPVNQSNLCSFTGVGAATSYQWQQTQLAPYTSVEGAENGLPNVTVAASAGYAVQVSDVTASGSYAFHLAQPDAKPQYLTLNPLLRPGATSQLTFAKRLCWATPNQVARAQISTNGGSAWRDVWSQAGNSTSGDAGFSTVTVSLGGYAGLAAQIRLVYDFSSGTYYPQTNSGVGLYLDDIAVSNADQLFNPITNTVPAGTTFAFCPTNAGSYLLSVRARINSRTLNWGPASSITVTSPVPAIQLASKPRLAPNQVQIDFTVTNYAAGMSFQLWQADSLTGTWTQDTNATFQTLVPGSNFRATVSTGDAARMFYRVKGLN